MELMPAHTQRSDCQNGSSLCAPLTMAVNSWQNTVDKLQELCKLPELEITPVAKVVSKKNETESSERSSSIGADTEEKNDMQNLLERLPMLNQLFQLHNKIGEGTFSTVYLASLRYGTSNRYYAVKHLTHNSHQVRIERELRCMTEIGGKENVVHAEYCLTSGDDCVTFIMPYLPHKKFNDYVLDMDADETRLYMKNLFIALRRVHSFNIIHRDVKPGNFLYNRETKQFLLVDFGLAQVVENYDCDKNKDSSAVDENMPIDYSKKRKRKESVSDKEKTTPVKRSKRMALKLKDNNVKVTQIPNPCGNAHYFENNPLPPIDTENLDMKSPVKQYPNKTDTDKTPLKTRMLNTVNQPNARRKKLFEESSPESKNEDQKNKEKQPSVLNAHIEKRGTNTPCNGIHRSKSFTPLVTNKSTSGSFIQVRNSRVVRQSEMLKSKTSEVFQKPKPRASVTEHCSCSGRGAICAMCSSRSKMVAPRAGTPGFRPPEVLFKYLNQTTAVDMWASGVILLCILSGCYPFFKSPNDLVALAEIMTVFGTEPIIKIAAKFGRRVVCSSQKKGVDLKKLCKLLRARATRTSSSDKKNPNDVRCDDCSQPIRKDGCLCISDNPSEDADQVDPECGFPNSAFDLLKRLLDLDPTTRITAAEALEHPFILGH